VRLNALKLPFKIVIKNYKNKLDKLFSQRFSFFEFDGFSSCVAVVACCFKTFFIIQAHTCYTLRVSGTSYTDTNTVFCTFTHGSSSSSSSSLSPLASSLTRSVFHSELGSWLFSKSFPPQTFSFPTGLIPRTLGPSNDFTLLNGWNCLHGVSD